MQRQITPYGIVLILAASAAGCGQGGQGGQTGQAPATAPATAPRSPAPTRLSPPVISEKARDFVVDMPEVRDFNELVKAHRGEAAIVGVDLRPGKRLETMVNRDGYAWPDNISNFYVVGVSTTNSRRWFRWQVFFIDPGTGEVYVLRDRDSGDLIPLRAWRDRSEPGSLDDMRRILQSE